MTTPETTLNTTLLFQSNLFVSSVRLAFASSCPVFLLRLLLFQISQGFTPLFPFNILLFNKFRLFRRTMCRQTSILTHQSIKCCFGKTLFVSSAASQRRNARATTVLVQIDSNFSKACLQYLNLFVFVCSMSEGTRRFRIMVKTEGGNTGSPAELPAASGAGPPLSVPPVPPPLLDQPLSVRLPVPPSLLKRPAAEPAGCSEAKRITRGSAESHLDAVLSSVPEPTVPEPTVPAVRTEPTAAPQPTVSEPTVLDAAPEPILDDAAVVSTAVKSAVVSTAAKSAPVAQPETCAAARTSELHVAAAAPQVSTGDSAAASGAVSPEPVGQPQALGQSPAPPVPSKFSQFGDIRGMPQMSIPVPKQQLEAPPVPHHGAQDGFTPMKDLAWNAKEYGAFQRSLEPPKERAARSEKCPGNLALMIKNAGAVQMSAWYPWVILNCGNVSKLN